LCGELEKILVQPDETDRFLRFNYDGSTEQYVANNKNILFDISDEGFINNPVLEVFIQGDIDEPESYFEILDESGQLIGRTPAGSCDSLTSIQFNLDPSMFNLWRQNDDQISFVARSSVGLNSINPCEDQAVQQDGDSDGVSQLYLQLSFEQVELRYSVSGATEIAEQDYHESIIPPVHEFNGGTSIISYILMDGALNSDTCTTSVILEDRQNRLPFVKKQ
jgi:hypothetical protein